MRVASFTESVGRDAAPRASRTGDIALTGGACESLSPQSRSALLARFCKSLKALRKNSVRTRSGPPRTETPKPSSEFFRICWASACK